MSYIIAIDEKLCTVHLKPRYFLAKDFMVYSYSQGIVNSQSSGIQSECCYQGYVKGYPNSLAILSACSGLRGILQFENVSDGIEPLDSTVEFQHVLYQLGNENNELGILTENSRSMEKYSVDYNIFISEKPETPIPDLLPLYLEMYVVVDKALYDYLGSDSMTVTNKVIEMINIVNSEQSHLQLLAQYLPMHIIVEKALYEYMGPEMMALTPKIVQVIGLVNTVKTKFQLMEMLMIYYKDFWHGNRTLLFEGPMT
ncbi:disintegrin and metalloproteinase domain-containing protein 32 isoform X2 [Heterocephalus glaber]|uniref:Disintegrin and metalloproteinase domain-containing protein 32 isoform X2 n=1 Tax=Heterocephalus glaber TaxID=10181 RepID=A0AAX6R8D8_HETGA|nr:disintegrin and metalloproteinase domain-containing protein 32 isoform X2 [Heterocephalus glaber]